MSTPLGDFLRARRDATRPEVLGLLVGPRRRAPGVRRSELAALADVSVEYLTRIEQGRDRHPSPVIVRALADALHLDDAERAHIQYLSKITSGGCGGPLASAPRQDVRPQVLALLNRLEPAPAMITNRLGDVLAHTDGFERLARPTGLLDGHRPNLTTFVFADERSRTVFPDWDRLADEQAFDLWIGPPTETLAELTAELSAIAGGEFTQRLNGRLLPPRGTLRWVHPVVGELRLDREILELPAGDAQQLVVFMASDGATTDALHRLQATESPALRVAN